MFKRMEPVPPISLIMWLVDILIFKISREGKERKGKGRERKGKGREREGKGKEGKGREGKEIGRAHV